MTSSGVGENASASENRASQLAANAVQLVEGTITNATVTYPTVAWACQPGMIRTYGASAAANGASSAPLAYYKLYSSGTMVVTSSMDMNPADIFSADVPATWDKMPSYYTDINAPLFVGIGEGADDLADGRGQFSHEGRDGEDLVALGKLGMLHEIDDLDVVTAGEVLFADELEIAKGGERFGRGPGDVETQLPIPGGWRGGFRDAGCGCCFHD